MRGLRGLMRVHCPAFGLGNGIFVDQRWLMEWEPWQWYIEDLPVGEVCELQRRRDPEKPVVETKRVKIEPGTGVQRAEW